MKKSVMIKMAIVLTVLSFLSIASVPNMILGVPAILILVFFMMLFPVLSLLFRFEWKEILVIGLLWPFATMVAAIQIKNALMLSTAEIVAFTASSTGLLFYLGVLTTTLLSVHFYNKSKGVVRKERIVEIN